MRYLIFPLWLFLTAVPALAAEPCGASLPEALDAAGKALSAQPHANEHAAFACLLQALQAVDARLHAVESECSPRVLIAPKGAWRNQR